MAQHRRHRFDDDLLCIEHAVDEQAEGLGADLDDHHHLAGPRFKPQNVG